MKKGLTGGAMIAAALFFTLPPVLEHSDNQVIKTEESQKEVLSETSLHKPVTLIETIDGDTIKVMLKGKTETIRYLLVDTPESKKPGMCVQPYAKEASIRNNQLVRKGRLTIELEKDNQRDDYGRLLAYVFVDGQSVQEILLKEGYARVAYIMNPPYKFLDVYLTDQSLAKRKKLKIWALKNYATNYGFNGCVEKRK